MASRIAVVGALFLVIQAAAFIMGLSLARSITGSIHEMFAGTERVGRGDDYQDSWKLTDFIFWNWERASSRTVGAQDPAP